MEFSQEKILQGLNDEQVAAVTHDQGPLLVIAGAGTGKTKVITHRIAYLIAAHRAKPEEIVALTFTDKAAVEMEERVDVLLPYGFANVLISTFHAFGDHILRQYALELGLTPDLQVLSRPEQVIFFRQHLFDFPLSYYRPLSEPTRFIDAMVKLISRAKDEDVSPEDYLAYAQSLKKKVSEIRCGEQQNPQDKELVEEAEKQMEIARTYQIYQQLLAKEGKLDFGDQVNLVLKLFRERPRVLQHIQKQFKYVLVDEFQDTNYAQFQLIKLLGKTHQNITVVGDDDQCLPPGTFITTPDGGKRIEEMREGDRVITAVGKGYVATSTVTRVIRNRKHCRLLTFETEKGYKITVTDNHKMFCFVPAVPQGKSLYYVYLMHRRNLGWRLGVTNDLAGRLRLERSADRIVGIRSCATEGEARFYETLLSLKYAIPTTPFKERNGQAVAGQWLQKLFDEIDTESNARRLAQDIGVDLDAHHFCLGGVYRGQRARIRINLQMCYRRYSSKARRTNPLKNPLISHLVSLETSDQMAIQRLQAAKIPFTPAKKGVRVRFASKDLAEIGELAKRLTEITGGILESKFAVGTSNVQHKPALVMPASNVLIGHYLPVLQDSRVLYDKVVRITQESRIETVYDLEISRTHNYVANGVVVHNSIYKFRGAAISNILNFMDTYPHARQVVLTQNYRSTQAILDTAYRLISHNNPDRLEVKNNIEKRLIGRTFGGKAVQHLHFDTLSSESDKVAKMIKEMVTSGNYSYNDIAILVRSNADADPFIRSLNQHEIPHYFSGGRGLYDREEIRLLIAFLRVIADFNDSLSLYHLASSEIYELSMKDLTRCLNVAKYQHRTLYEVFENLDDTPEQEQISLESRATIEKLMDDIHKYLELSRDNLTGVVLYRFLTESGYLKKLTREKSAAAEVKIQNTAKFFDIIKDFGNLAPHDRVPQFVDHLQLLIEAGDDPTAAEIDRELDAVNVLTVHKAKGLEFPVVFMVCLVQNKFPHVRRRESIELPEALIKDVLPTGDFHLQEERRLFYVGMTRAQKELYLTSSRDHGGVRPRKVSQFVVEALDKPRADEDFIRTKALEAIHRYAPSPKSVSSTLAPIPEERVISLSYGQIDDYLTCPLKYKYVHVLRVPIMPHHTVVFGYALHVAVGEYHRRRKNGQPITLEGLIRIFEDAWRREGFLSREHEEQRLNVGREALARFFQEQEKSDTVPYYVEEEFSFMQGTNRVVGRWDRVDVRDDKVYIIDFKSSEVWEQKKADEQTQKSLQMAIYALAFYRAYHRVPHQVELHFLESGLVGKAPVSADDFAETEEKIAEAAAGIRARNYTAKPDYMACRYCAYARVCPSTMSG